jgi:hypothetical protein
MTNRTYDSLKSVTQIVLPVLGALYFILLNFWDLPNALEVVGTIAIVDFILGAFLYAASSRYRRDNDQEAGSLRQVGRDPDTGMPHLALTITKLPDEIMAMKSVKLQIDQPA